MKAFNDTIAFIVEIVMLAALCIAGYQLATTTFFKYTLAITLPALAIILWSVWAAPKSKSRLTFPWLSVFKITLFSITALLLVLTGHITAAIVFGGVAWLNELIAQLLTRR